MSNKMRYFFDIYPLDKVSHVKYYHKPEFVSLTLSLPSFYCLSVSLRSKTSRRFLYEVEI